MASSLLQGLKWIVGLLFFSSSSILEAPPRRFGPNSPSLLGADQDVFTSYRTAFHFQPSKLWMNDPNGPMYYKGYYHLFYQHNPRVARWEPQLSWGHSVSTDLVNWYKLPFALNGSEWYDINGCWSGSATMLPDNTPVVVYTGINNVNTQVQAVAYPKDTSDPFLVEWVKPDYNPIIEPFEGVDPTLFRDPSTAWLGRDGQWRLVIGTVLGRDGHVILYKSKDFVKWEKAEKSMFYNRGSGMWECVDLFPLSMTSTGQTKYVLKVSMFAPYYYDTYTVGTYDEDNDVFVGDDNSSNEWWQWPRLDYGHIYASKTFFDDSKNRRVLWGWSNESDSVDKGWAGIQVVPRVLSLDSDGKRLIQWPVEEIESLRKGSPVEMHDVELTPGQQVEIKGLDASQADIEVEFEFPSPCLSNAQPFQLNWMADPSKLCREMGADVNEGLGSFGLLVLASSNSLEEHTAIHFRIFRNNQKYTVLMCVDPTRSSMSANVYKPASGGFVDVDIIKDGKISLRTMIDHSVVESFGGKGRTVITSRVYPTLLSRGENRVFAFNNGTGTVRILELKAWSMAKAQIS